MKKIILLSLAAVFILGFNACKKDKPASPGEVFDFTGCKYVSRKQSFYEFTDTIIYSNNLPVKLTSVDSNGVIQDDNYYVFRYENGQIAEITTYNLNQIQSQSFYTFTGSGKLSRITHWATVGESGYQTNINIHYGPDGNCDYLTNEAIFLNGSTIDSAITDSVLLMNYNSFGRPTLLKRYHKFVSASSTVPYSLADGREFEYDANGNRTKISQIQYPAGKKFVRRVMEFDLAISYNKEMAEFENLMDLTFYSPGGSYSEVPFKDGGDKNLITKETAYDYDGKIEWVSNNVYQFDANKRLTSMMFTHSQNPGSTTLTRYSYKCK